MNTPLKRFFPVIHCVCPYEEQGIGHALANARIAFENGADGIFLIGHGLHYEAVLYIYQQVRKQHQGHFIGVNLLDLSPTNDRKLLVELAKEHPHLSAIWMDGMPNIRLNISIRIELLGGVAFKYLAPRLSGDKLAEACRSALHYVNTVTTSGDKTGSAPDVAKLDAMRKIIGPKYRLALASGVTADNVESFKPFVDTFLVASSITMRREHLGNHEYLVPQKVRELAGKIHA